MTPSALLSLIFLQLIRDVTLVFHPVNIGVHDITLLALCEIQALIGEWGSGGGAKFDGVSYGRISNYHTEIKKSIQAWPTLILRVSNIRKRAILAIITI